MSTVPSVTGATPVPSYCFSHTHPWPQHGRRAWPVARHRHDRCGLPQARTQAFSQSARWKMLDLDRSAGVIRSVEHPFSREGGLAVLFGNLAPESCIVKTAGVHDALLTFRGTGSADNSRGLAAKLSLERYAGAGGGTTLLSRLSGPSANALSAAFTTGECQ